MRKIVLAFLIILVSVSVSFGASTKISELTGTQTLTDDDLFLVSTYATGSYTSKYITTQYVKSALGVMTIANDTLWDAAGDLVYGTGANTGSRLAIGAPYALLMTNAGATAPAWTYTLGATGTRLTKIWATDLEITNAPTINGAALTTLLQPLDGELTALAGLTSAAYAIPYFTGSGTAGVISSSSDIVGFLGSADAATGLTALGGWGVSGSITDEQLVCSETTGGSNLLKSCGAKVTYTEPATNVPLCRTGAATTGACTNILDGVSKIAVFNIPGTSDDGTVVDSYVPAAATITGVVVTTSGAACSAVVDIWSQAYADFPPENAQTITASAPPTITTAQMSKDTTLTGWTVAVAADTVLRANLDSSDCAGNIQVTIYGKQ